jgi:hypothetical protein
MAQGDRIIVGIEPGVLIPTEDPTFSENEWGFDDGKRTFVTHPATNKARWPQRNAPDAEWPQMYVREVIPRNDPSGLVELTVLYRGVMRFTAGVMKERLLPGCPISMFTLPALSSGSPAKVVAQVPKPEAVREYLTLKPPTLDGVSLPFAAAWLPVTPGFSISYVPDPDQAPTLNYNRGWVLDDRTWQDVAAKVFHVREVAGFYYALSV